MRTQPTEAEDALWQRLRAGKLGVRFRRQHVIGRFVVDFVCLPARLIVEVDGGIHENQQEVDAARDAVLRSLDYRVIRFTNTEVMHDIDDVIRRNQHLLI